MIGLATVPVTASGQGWRQTTVSMVAALATGAVIGLFAALYARRVQPIVLIQNFDDPSFVLTDAWIEAHPMMVSGGPRHFDVSPELVYFPLTGALCALVIVVAFEATRCVISRGRASRSPHDGP